MNIQITSGTGPHECELAVKYTVEEFLKEFGGDQYVKYDLEIHKVIELLKELNK